MLRDVSGSQVLQQLSLEADSVANSDAQGSLDSSEHERAYANRLAEDLARAAAASREGSAGQSRVESDYANRFARNAVTGGAYSTPGLSGRSSVVASDVAAAFAHGAVIPSGLESRQSVMFSGASSAMDSDLAERVAMQIQGAAADSRSPSAKSENTITAASPGSPSPIGAAQQAIAHRDSRLASEVTASEEDQSLARQAVERALEEVKSGASVTASVGDVMEADMAQAMLTRLFELAANHAGQASVRPPSGASGSLTVSRGDGDDLAYAQDTIAQLIAAAARSRLPSESGISGSMEASATDMDEQALAQAAVLRLMAAAADVQMEERNAERGQASAAGSEAGRVSRTSRVSLSTGGDGSDADAAQAALNKVLARLQPRAISGAISMEGATDEGDDTEFAEDVVARLLEEQAQGAARQVTTDLAHLARKSPTASSVEGGEVEEQRQAVEDASRRAAEEAAKVSALAREAELRAAADAEARRRSLEAQKQLQAKAQEEAQQFAAEEAARRQLVAEEEARIAAEEEEARRRLLQEQDAALRRQAEEEAAKRASEEEARRKAFDASQQKESASVDEALRIEASKLEAAQMEESKRRAAEEEARRQAAAADSARRRAEAEAKRQQLEQAEEELRREREASEAKLQADARDAQQRQLEDAEASSRISEEAERQARLEGLASLCEEAEHEAERREAEEAARRAAYEESERQRIAAAEEAARQALVEKEELLRREAEEAEKKRRDEEAARRKAAEDEETRRRATKEAEREAALAEQDAKLRAEAAAQAQRRAEEEEARRKQAAIDSARRRASAEEQAKKLAAAEAARQKAFQDLEAKRQAEEEDARLRAAEAEAERQQALQSARSSSSGTSINSQDVMGRLLKTFASTAAGTLRYLGDKGPMAQDDRSGQASARSAGPQQESARSLPSRQQEEPLPGPSGSVPSSAGRRKAAMPGLPPTPEKSDRVARQKEAEAAALRAQAAAQAKQQAEEEEARRKQAAFDSARRRADALAAEEQARKLAAAQAAKQQALEEDLAAKRKADEEEARVRAAAAEAEKEQAFASQALPSERSSSSGGSDSQDIMGRLLKTFARTAAGTLRYLGDTAPMASDAQSREASARSAGSIPPWRQAAAPPSAGMPKLDLEELPPAAERYRGQLSQERAVSDGWSSGPRTTPVVPQLWQPHPRSDGFAGWVPPSGSSEVSESLPATEPGTPVVFDFKADLQMDVTMPPTFVPQMPSDNGEESKGQKIMSGRFPQGPTYVEDAPPLFTPTRHKKVGELSASTTQQPSWAHAAADAPTPQGTQAYAMPSKRDAALSDVVESRVSTGRSSVSLGRAAASAARMGLCDPGIVSQLAGLLCTMNDSPPETGRQADLSQR